MSLALPLPAAVSPPPLKAPSPYLSTDRIVHIRPTSATNYRFIRVIQQIFRLIMEWLWYTPKPPYVGMVAAFDRRESESSMEDILSYMQRALQDDPHLRSSTAWMRKLQEQCFKSDNIYENLKYLSSNNGGNKEPSPERIKELKKIQRTILALKPGEVHVLLGEPKRGDELFFYFKRLKGGKLRLQILGRGETMRSLTSKKPKEARMEKALIRSKMEFEPISDSLVEKLLDAIPICGRYPSRENYKDSEQKKFFDFVQQELTEKPIVPLGSMLPESRDFLDTTWNLLAQVAQSQGVSEEVTRQSELRLKIYTLFSLFHDLETKWSPKGHDISALKRMHQLVAEAVLAGIESGEVGKNEAPFFAKELERIEKSIDRMQGVTTKSKISSMQGLSMKRLVPPVTAPPLIAPTLGERAPPPRSISSSNDQKLGKLESRQTQIAPVSLFRSSHPDSLLEKVRRIPSDPTPGEVVLHIQPIFNQLYIYKSASWSGLSRPEACTILQTLDKASQILTQYVLDSRSTSLDAVNSMKKILFIMSVLTCGKLNRPDLYDTLDQNIYVSSYSLLNEMERAYKNPIINSSHAPTRLTNGHGHTHLIADHTYYCLQWSQTSRQKIA